MTPATWPCQQPDRMLFAFCRHPECALPKGPTSMAVPIRSLLPGTPPTGPAGASSANTSEPKSVVRVFLRGGSHFDIVGAKDVTVTKPMNDLTRLIWEAPESGRPLYVRLDAVDAVVDITGAIE